MKEKIYKIVDEYYKNDMPGATLLISKNNSIVFNNSFGYKDIESKKMMTNDSTFLIASITKQFTCTAIMLLKEKGVLSYDDKVKPYFKDFPNWIEDITIRHLMTHTSGIPDYFDKRYFEVAGDKSDDDLKLDFIIDYIKGYDHLLFDVGTDFSYSNSAYAMLQYIIEHLSGMSYEDFLMDNIFLPLDMSDSYVPKNSIKRDSFATGYLKKGKGLFERAEYSKSVIGWADGNMISSSADLLKWSVSLRTKSVVDKESIAEAFNSHITESGKNVNYGFGQFISDKRGVKEVWHTGGTIGFRLMLYQIPSEDVTIVMLTNSGPVSDIRFFRILNEIIMLVTGNVFERFNDIDDDVTLDNYLGEYKANAFNIKLSKDERGYVFKSSMDMDKMATCENHDVNEVIISLKKDKRYCDYKKGVILEINNGKLVLSHYGKIFEMEEVQS